MKVAPASKNTLAAHHIAHHDGVTDSFLVNLCRMVGLERKQLAYELHVSNTTVDRWCSGERADPIARAKAFVDVIKKRNSSLVGMILLEIAGDGFDTLVIDRVKTALGKKD